MFLLLLGGSYSFAQNNPIFFGGSGEGSSAESYAQTYADFRIGGIGDGHNYGSYAQTYADFRLGGVGDGHNFGSYAQNYTDMRKGGLGDGWASNVVPLQPLPLQLLSFTGKDIDGKHLLQWTTAAEVNTDYFLLEHTTQSSVSYAALGRVEAAGNSAGKQQYDFTNEHPKIGDNFYRLRMVDVGGKETFSNVVLLKVLKNGTGLLFYPNPTASVLNIELGTAIDNSPIHLEVYDMAGRRLATYDLEHNQQTQQLDVSKFATGNYVIRIQSGNSIETIKFSKVN